MNAQVNVAECPGADFILDRRYLIRACFVFSYRLRIDNMPLCEVDTSATSAGSCLNLLTWKELIGRSSAFCSDVFSAPTLVFRNFLDFRSIELSKPFLRLPSGVHPGSSQARSARVLGPTHISSHIDKVVHPSNHSLLTLAHASAHHYSRHLTVFQLERLQLWYSLWCAFQQARMKFLVRP